MTARAALADVIHNAVLAADAVAIRRDYPTEAARTRAVVARALEFAVGNGLVTVTPRDQWPEWLAMDPPFRLPGARP